jgi:hypothetical protein
MDEYLSKMSQGLEYLHALLMPWNVYEIQTAPPGGVEDSTQALKEARGSFANFEL